MSRRLECDNCGLAASDLPDGVDAELIFETGPGGTFCQGCDVCTDCGGRRYITDDRGHESTCPTCKGSGRAE